MNASYEYRISGLAIPLGRTRNTESRSEIAAVPYRQVSIRSARIGGLKPTLHSEKEKVWMSECVNAWIPAFAGTGGNVELGD